MIVKKFNGKRQEFDKLKIEEAIKRAAHDAKANIKEFKVKRIANKIEEDLLEKDTKIISSSDLSKLVEDELMSADKDTAWHYITYHYKKEQEQLYNSSLIKEFQKKLNGVNVENSNANCDEKSFSGRMNEAATIIYKDDALHNMSSKFRRNHENNYIYIHDLSSYSAGLHNCLSIPFDELLNKNVYTKQTGIRPPKSIQTACQLVAVIIQIQSLQQFGGVSSTHLDWTLVPFVRHTFFKHLRDGHKYYDLAIRKEYENFMKLVDAKHKQDQNLRNTIVALVDERLSTIKKFKMPKDIENTSIEDYKDDPCYQYAIELTIRDAHQGAEGLIHNLNSLQSRSGNQLPFSSINYGTCTLPEGRMITKAILDCTLAGTGPLNETPIFPCGIFQWDAEINGKPGTPNYDLFKQSLDCTARRFYPNYCNVNWSVNVKGIKKDREIKRNVINKLSTDDFKTLIDWIRKNPNEAIKINLKAEGRNIVVDNTPGPMEINSTMGKCKLQLI